MAAAIRRIIQSDVDGHCIIFILIVAVILNGYSEMIISRQIGHDNYEFQCRNNYCDSPHTLRQLYNSVPIYYVL